MVDFAHLRTHSTYSLSEGASSLEALVKRARDAGMPAFALTDRENLFGAMTFSKEASSKGIQPIVGCQFYIDYAPGKRGNILLLAQNATGYGNLCYLLRSVSEAKTEDVTTSAPSQSLDPDTLREHSDGIILLTGGGTDGLLPQLAVLEDGMVSETYQWLLSVFGDRLYIEICRNDNPTDDEARIEDVLIDLAHGGAGAVQCDDGEIRSEAPLVATTDIWYATPDRHDAWNLLSAVVGKSSVTMDGDSITSGSRVLHHMRTPEEMAELFRDLPEAFDNAAHIAQRCSFMVKGRAPILPPFPCEPGRTEAQELAGQAREGLRKRLEKAKILGDDQDAYWKRIDYELGVIERMGFPGYFLIVSDFIKWAKANEIPVGPGRGSGAGSVVAWALTITDLNPLSFNLLFERFLNPDRISMPDFDIDFCQDRREEVRDYVYKRYGSDKVALISTFGYIKSKTALKDVQRILVHDQLGAVSFSEVNDLTRSIPKKEEGADPMGLDEAYRKDPNFKTQIDGSPKLRMLFDQAKKIEGLIRTSGSHAAGVVIGDRPLEDLVPISYDAKAGIAVAGFDMKGVEAAGLVKFDFLGLTTLSVMKLTTNYIKEARGIDLDLELIPLQDTAVYEKLALGDCTGVFQFESEGMRDVMRKIKPTCFEDLIAIVALYRPGPMDYIPDFAARKAGRQEFAYPGGAERTQAFLSETYGIMVYQEQVMQVAQSVAGYSLGGADLLRRAMGKKDAKEMARQRRIFVHGDESTTPPVPGAIKLGMTETAAEALFEDILPFANYGFNKSHAAAYAWIGYQTAWLKTHYPAEYLSALMSYYDDADRLTRIKNELDAMGVPLLPPDVNRSHQRFSPEAHKQATGGFAVRFGLSAIKQISGASANLIDERSSNGDFKSLEDFHKRVGNRFNKAHYEHLAQAGAFDSLSNNRRQAAEALAWLAARKDKAPVNQGDMFGGLAAVAIPKNIMELEEWSDSIQREYKSVGFYINRHPIDSYVPRLMVAGIRRRASYHQWMLKNNVEHLDKRHLCVMVEDVKRRVSKRGSSYLMVTVQEKSDTFQVACFENRRDNVTIDDFDKVLQGAKVSRRPIVLETKVVLNGDQSALNVTANNAWDVDTYLASVRGNILINILVPDPVGAVAPTASDGTIPTREQLSQTHAFHSLEQEAAADLLITRLESRIEKTSRSEDGRGSLIRIQTQDGYGRVLPGVYNLSPAAENMIRAEKGFVSMKELRPSVRAREQDNQEPSAPPSRRMG